MELAQYPGAVRVGVSSLAGAIRFNEWGSHAPPSTALLLDASRLPSDSDLSCLLVLIFMVAPSS